MTLYASFTAVNEKCHYNNRILSESIYCSIQNEIIRKEMPSE